MWADLRAAVVFLTIVPLRHVEGRRPGRSLAWYPLVGAGIGGILALLAQYVPLSSQVTALVVLLAWVILTGGLHVDGLGDTCDGLLATATPERRLEIMRDPHSGTWAVLGIVLLLLGKWLTIQTVSPWLLMLPAIVGRWVMVVAAYAFPYARPAGLGSYYRDGLGFPQLLVASVLAFLGVLWVARAWEVVIVAFAIAGVTVSLGGSWAVRRLGGLTGDVYGALCECTEFLCLMGLGYVWGSA